MNRILDLQQMDVTHPAAGTDGPQTAQSTISVTVVCFFSTFSLSLCLP